MPGSDHIAELRKDYRTKRRAIEQRLAEFRAIYEHGDEAIFEELCFCILTAGSSARMGMRTIAALRDILLSGTEKDLQARAGEHRVRFWRLRPSYIYRTREHLKETCDLKLRELLDSFPASSPYSEEETLQHIDEALAALRQPAVNQRAAGGPGCESAHQRGPYPRRGGPRPPPQGRSRVRPAIV